MIGRRAFVARAGAGAAGLALLPGCASLAGPAGTALPRTTPEAAGIPSSAITDFLQAAAQRRLEMHGFMLVRHGQVVAEGWWKPYGPQFVHSLYSMSKSFTSTAVGLAVAEGRLSVDDPVLKFFPGDAPASVSGHLAALRVRDLLTMSVGHDKEPAWDLAGPTSWVRQFLAAPIAHEPGRVFRYSSAATYMCSAIVQRVTGMRMVEYLRPRLFEPLGIEQFHWETCPQGIDVGGWGLSLQTESLARFGQLYLQGGVWKGRQLVPASWVVEATSRQVQQPLPARPTRPHERNDWLQGYGYQFWRCTHGAFRGDGAFGQFTVVMPRQGAVLALHSECADMQAVLDLVWQHLLPAMGDAPLPADRPAQARLQQVLEALALPLPRGEPASAMAARVSGRTFRLAPNALGLESVAFVFEREATRVAFRHAGGTHVLEAGVQAWREGRTALPGTPPRLSPGGAPPAGTMHRCVGAGAWQDGSTFELLLRFVETAHHDRLTFRFGEGDVQVAFLGSIAAMSARPRDPRPVLQGTLT